MDNEWKCQTCGTCDFRAENKECRKSPPHIQSKRKLVSAETGCYAVEASYAYPMVKNGTPACSYWRERN